MEILEPIPEQIVEQTLGDSFQFVVATKEIVLDKKAMFSLDVASLFTNGETVGFLCPSIKAEHISIGIPTESQEFVTKIRI